MLTPDDAQFLADSVTGLGQPLHEALEAGRKAASEHYDQYGMTGAGYTKGRTDLTRDHARKLLEDPSIDLSGWSIAKGRSGRLSLHHNALHVRVLHVEPVEGVPAPGRNQARIRYYSNHNATLGGAEASSLLAIWRFDPKISQVAIRVVRPTGAWRYRQNHVADFDIPLPRRADEYRDFVFTPNDTDIPLPFSFDEDIREEGERGGA